MGEPPNENKETKNYLKEYKADEPQNDNSREYKGHLTDLTDLT